MEGEVKFEVLTRQECLDEIERLRASFLVPFEEIEERAERYALSKREWRAWTRLQDLMWLIEQDDSEKEEQED